MSASVNTSWRIFESLAAPQAQAVLAGTLGWLAGLMLGAAWFTPTWLGVTLAGLSLLVGWASRRALPLWVALAALALGLARIGQAQPQATTPAELAHHHHPERRILLEGVVDALPDVRDDRVNLRLRAENVWVDGQVLAVTGVALVQTERFSAERATLTGASAYAYGDRVRVVGVLDAPPALPDFSYRDYLARFGVQSFIPRAQVTFVSAGHGEPFWQALLALKVRALAVTAQLFPEPQAALLQGIVLGVEANIPADVKEAFSVTGTSHIVAISGFNIAILVGVFAGLFTRLAGRTWGMVLTLVVISLFTLLVGAGASVVRAALMGAVGVIGTWLGRPALGLNALAVSVVGMTVVNPLILWDVGFQLSALATLGLMVYATPLQHGAKAWLARRWGASAAEQWGGLLSEVLLTTLAAQITTLPALAYYFQSVSLITFVANAFILPAQPLLMMLAGLAIVAGLVWLPLGQLLAFVAQPLAAYTLALVHLFAQVPSAALYLSDPAPVVLAYCVGLVLLTAVWAIPAEVRPLWLSTLYEDGLPLGGLAVGGALAVAVWGMALTAPDGRWRITVLDVGAGEAVLIQTAEGRHVVLNTGPSGQALSRALAAHLPHLTREVDVLVLGATTPAALGGAPDMLARYRVGLVVQTAAPGFGGLYAGVQNTLIAQGVPRHPASPDTRLDLGAGGSLSVLAEGERGSVWLLEIGKFRMVLPLGGDRATESALLMRGAPLAATVMLVANQGTDSATQPAWVETVRPRLVIIPHAAERPPAPAVLQRLAGYTVLTTAEHGHITLRTDGEHWWVETQR